MLATHPPHLSFKVEADRAAAVVGFDHAHDGTEVGGDVRIDHDREVAGFAFRFHGRLLGIGLRGVCGRGWLRG